MEMETDVLIIGAGPFGLCLAAHVQQLGLDYCMAGRPMEFWRENMPEGMYLRSACDWHLDADNIDTIERFLAGQGLTAKAVEPLSLNFYQSYVQWFQDQKRLNKLPLYVRQLDVDADGRFTARMEDGSPVRARRVVVAVGFKYFAHAPEDLVSLLPAGRWAHTCDFVQFEPLRGKSCLILGGRQSAFEWAALLAEAGASEIHLAYRHDTPAFVEADWSWVNKIVADMADNPGWYRGLTEAEQKKVWYKLWAEGRLKLEPWLKDRIENKNVRLWPNTRVASSAVLPDGRVEVRFDPDGSAAVDQIVLATGYKSDMVRIPFFQNGNILSRLAVRDGFPRLDEAFQSNIPGLYVTSLPAGQDFGPFFGFTVAVRTAAKVIGRSLLF